MALFPPFMLKAIVLVTHLLNLCERGLAGPDFRGGPDHPSAR